MPLRRSALPARLVFGLCAGALAGCGPAGEEEPDLAAAIGSLGQPIQGGFIDEFDKPVVGIAIMAGGMSACTGTLITPNLVLTAQHCVAPTLGGPGGAVICGQTTFGAAYAGTDLQVTTHTTMPMIPSAYVDGAEVHVAPGDGSFCGNDFAVLVLSRPLDGTEAWPITPRVDVGLSPGELYSAVGYGQTYDDPMAPSGTRYRRDGLRVVCVGEGCGTPSVAAAEWGGEEGVCSGDSGGPALDKLGRVTGVASRGSFGCTTPIYGDVADWGQWIKEMAIYANGLMGVEPPSWATGWPTDPAFSMPVGEPCDVNVPAQCPSGICHEGYCTRVCNDFAPCQISCKCEPALGICVSTDLWLPEAKKREQSSGCRTAVGGVAADSLQRFPWIVGLGALAALSALRRRRRRDR